jgi:hypothetical protein
MAQRMIFWVPSEGISEDLFQIGIDSYLGRDAHILEADRQNVCSIPTRPLKSADFQQGQQGYLVQASKGPTEVS